MNHRYLGILLLFGGICSATPHSAIAAGEALQSASSPDLAFVAPAPVTDRARRNWCSSSMNVPYDVTLKAIGAPPVPGGTVTISGDIAAKADLSSIQVAYETTGPAQLIGARTALLAAAGSGDSRTFTVDVATRGSEPWSVTVHVEAVSPDGRTWEHNEGFYGVEYNGRLLTGMGSPLQLRMKAIEEDYNAGILNEKEAREQALALRQIDGTWDETPRVVNRAMTVREQEAKDGLKPAPVPEGQAAPSAALGGCHHIEGNVSWLDENGNVHPAFGITVEIWDEDLVIDEFVDNTITDVNGNYAIDVDDDDGIGAGSRDIYVKIVTANGAISIEPQGIFTGPYEARHGTHDEAPCGTITENFTADNIGTGPAVNLCECGSWRSSYVANDFRGGSFLPQIVAEWPGDTGSANYDGSDINLRPGDRWDWDVFMHEYGHYVQDTYNIEDNPGGAHNIGDCISDVHSSKDEGVKMAFAEGWPTYDGTVAQFYYNLASKNIPRVGDADYADTGESSFNYGLDTQDSNGLGEDNEVAMQRVFWDLWDNVSDGRDAVSTSEVTLFNIITGNNSETLSQAWGAIRATLSNSDQLAYGNVITDQTIGPSLNSPAANAIVSPSNNNNFSWDRNVGCSTTYDGDGFTLRFFRADNSAPILSIPVGNTTSHALTLGELQSLVAATHNVKWAVEGSNSSGPATGPYLGENFAAVINQPPVADAGTDQPNVECTSYTTTPVQLNGTGSSDPDGDALTYTWSAPAVTFDNNHSATPTGQFPDGTTVVTLTVSDGIEEDTDTVSITVVDTTPPVPTCPSDVTVECNDHCSGGGVPKGDPLLTAFFAGFSAVDVCDPTPTLSNNAPACFPVGNTTVTFYAKDDDNNIDSCTAVVTVEDTTPPEITVELNRDALWPPNHKLADIGATVTVTDICDPDPTFVLTSITSNEPDNGTGDGDTDNDIQNADYGTDDTAFSLRSERAGGGSGRKYTIIYTASDASGNTAQDTVCVRVPHDQSGHAMACTGFTVQGTSFEPLVETYRIVVFSTPLFKAWSIDTRYATVGNTGGAIKPVLTKQHDLNGDDLVDLELSYDVRATLELKKLSTKKEPLGLHYRSADGTDYLVANIFDLGRPFQMVENEGGSHEGDSQVSDGSGDPNASGTQGDQGGLTTPTAFQIAESGRVSVEIFTVTGRKVRTMADRDFSAGRYDLSWDGRDDSGSRMPSGIYFYRIQGPGVHDVRKIHIAR